MRVEWPCCITVNKNSNVDIHQEGIGEVVQKVKANAVKKSENLSSILPYSYLQFFFLKLYEKRVSRQNQSLSYTQDACKRSLYIYFFWSWEWGEFICLKTYFKKCNEFLNYVNFIMICKGALSHAMEVLLGRTDNYSLIFFLLIFKIFSISSCLIICLRANLMNASEIWCKNRQKSWQG